jgi:hypothetical protein
MRSVAQILVCDFRSSQAWESRWNMDRGVCLKRRYFKTLILNPGRGFMFVETEEFAAHPGGAMLRSDSDRYHSAHCTLLGCGGTNVDLLQTLHPSGVPALKPCAPTSPSLANFFIRSWL